MKHYYAIVLVSFFAGSISDEAGAQTQPQFDRVNQLALYTVTAPLCEKLGFKLSPDAASRFQMAAKNEWKRLRVGDQTSLKLYNESVQRQGENLKVDLSNEKRARLSSSQLKNFFLDKAKICVSAVEDSVFSNLMSMPKDFDVEHAARDLADSLLSRGGLASWQTAKIRARGDLLMAAGACRSQLGGDKVDLLFEKYARSADVQERNYYLQAYSDGLSDITMNLNVQQCNRAILGFEKKLR